MVQLEFGRAYFFSRFLKTLRRLAQGLLSRGKCATEAEHHVKSFLCCAFLENNVPLFSEACRSNECMSDRKTKDLLGSEID